MKAKKIKRKCQKKKKKKFLTDKKKTLLPVSHLMWPVHLQQCQQFDFWSQICPPTLSSGLIHKLHMQTLVCKTCVGEWFHTENMIHKYIYTFF